MTPRDVPLREAIILYNPRIAGLPPVAVVPIGYDNDAYRCSCGAAYAAWRHCSWPLLVGRLFTEFNTLTIREGIPVENVHAAFMCIPEYRQLIAPDIKGAEEQTQELARALAGADPERPGTTRQSDPLSNPSQSRLAPRGHERNGWQGPQLVSMRTRAAWWAGLGALERLALAHLSDMQHEDAGGSYASQSTLAAWCGVSRRGMQRALARLITAGLVTVTGQLAHDHPLVVAGRAAPGVVVYRVRTATRGNDDDTA